MQLVNCDSYCPGTRYPKLQHFTFATEFVPLTRGEARAIALAYRANFIDRQERHRLSEDHRQALRTLEVCE